MLRNFTSTLTPIKAKVTLAVTTSIACLIFAVVVWSGGAPAHGAEAAVVGSVQGPNPRRIETELITLRTWGFEPGEITRPAGRFFLAVDNRSGLRDADVRLFRAAGNSQQLVPLPKGKKGWRKEYELPPGEYRLTE